MPKQITIEMVNEYPGRDDFYYADLELPAEEYEIRDALQRARDFGQMDGYREISILNCDLLPALVGVRMDSPTLDELNFFAKRLDGLNDEERLVFRAVSRRILPDNLGNEIVSMKDLINCTYGLDEVMIASNVASDEQLGQFVIDNDLHEDVASIPNNALYLLDKKQVGRLQRRNDGGVFIDGCYVVAGDYKMPEVYGGKTLPDEAPTEWFAFRMKVGEYPTGGTTEKADDAEWLSLPTNIGIARDMAIKHHEPSIESCACYGFESAIPQISSEMLDSMLNFEKMNRLAWKIEQFSPMDQVKFKAVLTVNPPKDVDSALDTAEHLDQYELSYYSDSAASFYKDYLRHFLDSRFDGAWLDTLITQNEGEQLLERLGAAETPYGVISARGHSLFELVPYNEPELSSQGMTDEKLDVIEVLGAKALFSNGRLLPEEIPEGLYAYDLKESDNGDRFVSIEPKVSVNHGGTVLMKEILDFGQSGFISFDEDSDPNFLGYTMTAREFADEEQTEDENQEFGGMQL